jgi:hypothetical protein
MGVEIKPEEGRGDISKLAGGVTIRLFVSEEPFIVTDCTADGPAPL